MKAPPTTSLKKQIPSSNCVIKFGFNHRFHYSVMEAKAIIDSGRYGNILWAREYSE